MSKPEFKLQVAAQIISSTDEQLDMLLKQYNEILSDTQVIVDCIKEEIKERNSKYAGVARIGIVSSS